MLEPRLRPVQPADQEFLWRVYASTRADELMLTDWDAAQKEAFTRMQFEAQARFYQENYPGALYQVIETGSEPAGRLYIHRSVGEIRLMDVALLPEFRGQGLGSQVIAGVQALARQAGLPLTIHVERFNPALSLYNRLGFHVKEDRGVYLFLEWLPTDR